MNTRDKYIQAVKNKADLYDRWAAEEREKLNDTDWFPEIEFNHTVSESGYIFVPFDRNIMREMIPYLEAQGWEHASERDVDEREAMKTNSYVSQTFYRSGHYIHIVYVDNLEGAKCKRTPIGEKTVKQTVYAFLCPDGEERQ